MKIYSKEQLISYGFISVSVTDDNKNNIAIQPSFLKETSLEMVNNVVASIKELATEDNFKNIISKLIRNGIKFSGLEEKTTEKDKEIIKEKYYKNEKIETTTVTYDFIFGNDFQKLSEKSQKNNNRLLNSIKKLNEDNALTEENIESLARSFINMSQLDDVLLKLQIDSGINTTIKEFNKFGFKSATELKNNEPFFKKEKNKANVTTSHYYKNGILTKSVKTDINNNFPIISTSTYEYNENQTKVKTVVAEASKNDELKVLNYVHKYYTGDKLDRILIKDRIHGRISYTFDDMSNIRIAKIENKEEVMAVKLNITDKTYKGNSDYIELVKELGVLENGLLHLEEFVSEIEMSYKTLLFDIHNQKLVAGIKLIEDKKVLAYLGDKGNITLYEKNGTKLTYYPKKNSELIYKTCKKAKGNVLVEQQIKDGNNVEAIKTVYWLGNQKRDGKEQIYAFHRVVKALTKNENTPSDILLEITKQIIDGTYDNAYLIFIAKNPSANSETLQLIWNYSYNLQVRGLIKVHPNCPDNLEQAKEDAEKAKNKEKVKELAKKILS